MAQTPWEVGAFLGGTAAGRDSASSSLSGGGAREEEREEHDDGERQEQAQPQARAERGSVFVWRFGEVVVELEEEEEFAVGAEGGRHGGEAVLVMEAVCRCGWGWQRKRWVSSQKCEKTRGIHMLFSSSPSL